MFWLLGSVAGASWSALTVPLIATAVCALVLATQARPMNALSTGDDAAAGMGVGVNQLRILLLVASSLLTAAVVSSAGGIGFVGLIVPHAVRLVVGPDHRKVLPVSVLLGAVFLVLVDLVTRTIDRPNEMPIGIFTAALGRTVLPDPAAWPKASVAMRVQVRGVAVTIDATEILADTDLTVEAGTVTGLVGPNGSGKSTLLRCVYRALRPVAGTVHIGADDVWKSSARQAGRRTAVVTQDHDLDNDFSVAETVAMGRLPHKGLLERDTQTDHDVVHNALSRVDMTWAANRVFARLSGGERQRMLVARALTQQAPVLLLDEPTNHLDVGSQLDLLDLVRELGLTTIAALHDLDHATAYCDQLVLLHAGRVAAAGTPADVLTTERVAEVFGVRSAIVPHPLTGRPHFVTAPRLLVHADDRPGR